MEVFRNQGGSLKKRNISIVIGLFIIVLAIILMAVLIPKHKNKGGTDRIECPGFSSKSDCESNRCVYEPVQRGPTCYMTKDSFGYKIVSKVKDDADGKNVTLLTRTIDTPYGPAINSASFQATYLTENSVRIKIIDDKNPRYEVPVQKIFPLLQRKHQINNKNLAYEVVLANGTGGTFTFQIKRKLDNEVLWDTSIGGLIMSDQFLQIASYLPSNNIYGLGENVHPTLSHDLEYATWPMFSRDHPPIEGKANLYGVHPFYTCLEKSSKSHAVLFLNSNAMEVTLLPEPGISFRSIGGILDLFFFVGDSPEHVSQLYTSLIGRAMMPPYWGLGFQLARYGYNNLENVQKVVERTKNAGIAQDVQVLDIDHMDKSRDFTYNQKDFAGLREYIMKTKEEQGLKWIIILDPAIEAVKGYDAYETGLHEEVFIRRSENWKADMFPENVRDKNVTYGKVWPNGVAAFPDFLNLKTKEWWAAKIVNHYNIIPFDGLWIDMNEPANFGTNEDRPFYCNSADCWSLKCPKSQHEDPPYNPLVSGGSDRLSKTTLCMDSVQWDGKKYYRHYDIHSLYGWSQTKPTLDAAQVATGTRSLVISRSTYPSSGQHSGHWLGDNKSSWVDLRNSVIGIMEFNLFGIPYIGADVCGFNLDTTDELCARWMQLGAFYPFYRNHNVISAKDQDPAALSSDVVKASKGAVERRYNLMPYLYTLFYRAHTKGDTVIRPLFHEFPSDANTWNNGEQFMWGKCMIISPILREGEKTVRFYLPKGGWWLYRSAEEMKKNPLGNEAVQSNGEYREKSVKITENIPVHVRSGCIIPTEPYQLKRPFKLENQKIDLFIYLQNGEATGELFIDDGLSKDTIENKNYDLFKFTLKNCILNIKNEGYQKSQTTLQNIHIHKANFASKRYEVSSASINKVLPALVDIDLSTTRNDICKST